MKKILITLSLIGLYFNAYALVTYNLTPELADGSSGWYSVTANGNVLGSDASDPFTGTAGGGALADAFAAFKLPDIFATSVSNATFSADAYGISEAVPAKLEILGVFANQTINAASYSLAALSNADDTFNDPATAGTKNSDSTVLTNYLNSLDSATFDNGNYLLLRIKRKTDPAGVDRRVYYRNPVLTFTAVVPEPSTYALIAGSLVLGACMLRRRKKA